MIIVAYDDDQSSYRRDVSAMTHVTRSGSEKQQVKRNGGKCVDQKPSFDVVDGNFLRICYHLTTTTQQRDNDSNALRNMERRIL